jgi:ketosteroid isomerase-like protein
MPSEVERNEARLRRLEDLEEIRLLRMRYHYYVNERVMREAAVLYTEDAYVEFQSLKGVKGRAEIEAFYDSLNGNVDSISQFVANHMVTVEGDEATGVCYADARYAQQGQSIIASIRYDDKYRRTAEGWRFSEMIVKIRFAVPLTQGWAQGNMNAVRMVE